MASLHWTCVLTLAVVCCLMAQPLKRDVSSGLKIFDEFIQTVEKAKCLDVEARFYTPTDVNNDCLGSALNCSLRELEVLYDECKPVSEEYENIYNDLLTELKEIQHLPDSSCSDQAFFCEKLPQKHFKDFLEDFQSLLEQMNSESEALNQNTTL